MRNEICIHVWYLLHGVIAGFLFPSFIRWIMSKCYTGPPKAPSLNLAVNVWQNFIGIFVYPPVAAPTLVTVCNLMMGERVYGFLPANNVIFMGFAKLTDVHWARALGGVDYLECPAGSGMFYKITSVEDVGRGFPNEWRCVCAQHTNQPDPLP